MLFVGVEGPRPYTSLLLSNFLSVKVGRQKLFIIQARPLCVHDVI